MCWATSISVTWTCNDTFEGTLGPTTKAHLLGGRGGLVLGKGGLLGERLLDVLLNLDGRGVCGSLESRQLVDPGGFRVR